MSICGGPRRLSKTITIFLDSSPKTGSNKCCFGLSDAGYHSKKFDFEVEYVCREKNTKTQVQMHQFEKQEKHGISVHNLTVLDGRV